MNIIALSVAGALSAPVAAFAQASGIQIYGRANLGFDNYSARGASTNTADFKSRNRVYDAGSRLGFRGTEDLGSGLKAVFLMESGVNFDSGGLAGQSGSPNPNTGTLSSRVGHVGLQGGWGQLTFGRSHVWWANGAIEQTGANYLAAANPAFYGLLGRGMNVGVSRQSNTLQYTVATGGFAGQLSYSPGGEAAQAGANADGKLWAATLQGQWGYDWTKVWGNSPAAGSRATSTGHKLRAGWFYQPGAVLSLIWVKSEQDNGGILAVAGVPAALGLLPDVAPSLSQTSWGLNWEHAFGNVQALAQWGKVNNITGCVTAGACNDTNATTWVLGVRYNMSKRTAAYVNYATVRNAANYNMDFIGGWMTSANTPIINIPGLGAASVGADPRTFGVGVMHNF